MGSRGHCPGENYNYNAHKKDGPNQEDRQLETTHARDNYNAVYPNEAHTKKAAKKQTFEDQRNPC